MLVLSQFAEDCNFQDVYMLQPIEMSLLKMPLQTTLVFLQFDKDYLRMMILTYNLL